MSRVPELFGSMVFSESVMRERMHKNVYRAMCEKSARDVRWNPTWPTWWPPP